MRIERIELRNVCGHRELSRELHPRVTTITGANGTGKTTVLLAAEAILTGGWDVFAGNKALNIAQLAGPRDPSFGRLVFVHGDARVEVLRSLRPNKSEIRVNGGEVERGDTRVSEVVQDVLGKPLDLLSRVLFLKQKRLDAFLVAKPADRAATFQDLFGTAIADKVYELLGKELQDTPLIQATDEREDLRGRIAESRYRLEALAGELAQLPPPDPAAAERAAVAIRAQAEREELLRQSVAIHNQRQPVAERLEADLRTREEPKTLLDFCVNLCEQVKPRLAEARELLAAWQTYKAATARRDDLLLRRERVAAEIADRPDWVPPPAEDLAAAAAYREHGQALYHRLQVASHLIESFKDGKVACPTCGTPTADLQARLEAARAEYPALYAEYVAQQQADARVAAYEKSKQQDDLWLASRQSTLANLDAQLAQADPGEPPVRSEAEIQKFVVEARAAEDRRAEYQRRVSALDLQIGRAEGVLQELDRQRGELERRLQEVPRVDPKEHDAALASSREHAELAARRGALEGQVRELERQLGGYEARIVEVEATLRRAAARRAWRELVEEMRKYVHRDGLPKLVSQMWLAELQDEIQRLLQDFGSPFRVAVQEDLSFLAHFLDGRVQPQARLSPGQLTVLALAFWVAVNSIVVGGIGFLAMDEPTDSLDARNKKHLERAVERLRGISQSRGLQVLIVTHDEALGRLSDDNWDLGGW